MTSHYLSQWWFDYRRIYASLGLNELKVWYAQSSVPVLFCFVYGVTTLNHTPVKINWQNPDARGILGNSNSTYTWELHYHGLTHWGRVMHIWVSKLTIIGSDNGLSPGRHQAIISTNAGLLLIWTSGTNFSEISSEIHTFSFIKCIWKCRLRNCDNFVSASMC